MRGYDAEEDFLSDQGGRQPWFMRILESVVDVFLRLAAIAVVCLGVFFAVVLLLLILRALAGA